MSSSKPRRASSFTGNYSDNVHVSAKQIAAEILASLGFPRETTAPLLDKVTITGPADPFLPCVMRLSDVMTAMHVCIGSLANLYGQARTGGSLQGVTVDTETAALQFFAPFCWEWSARKLFPDLAETDQSKPLLWREGTRAATGFPPADAVVRFVQSYGHLYETGDRRWVFISALVNAYPPDQLLKLVGFTEEEIPKLMEILATKDDLTDSFNAFKTAIRRNPSNLDLERQMFEKKAGGCWAIKSLDEFLDSEQGDWSRTHDQIHIDKVEGWAPVGFGEQLKDGEGIYAGIKVVEMTRIVMGPVISSFVAGMGGDVVRIMSSTVNELPYWDFTQTTNKRCVSLDLKKPEDKAVMDKLLDEADVVLQNNSYGAVERLGYGFEALCERFKGRKKGFIYAEGNTMGFTGTWASSGGFETVGQIVSGVSLAMGREVHHDGQPTSSLEEIKPWFFPGTMCDATTGMSGAVGLHAALYRRATEGGSYRVRVALARTGMFYQEIGMYAGKELRRGLMDRFEYVDPEPSTTNRFTGVLDAFFQFHEALRDSHPHLFTSPSKHWMSFHYSPFRGVPLRIVKPAYSLERNPPRVRLQPRPLGWDSKVESRIYEKGKVEWKSGLVDVEREGDEGGGGEWKFRTVTKKSALVGETKL